MVSVLNESIWCQLGFSDVCCRVLPEQSVLRADVFAVAGPSFSIAIRSDVITVYPWETAKMECSLSVLGSSPKTGTEHTHTHTPRPHTLLGSSAGFNFLFFLLVSKHIFHTHVTLLLMRIRMMQFLHLKQSFQWKESLVCKRKHLLPPVGVCNTGYFSGFYWLHFDLTFLWVIISGQVFVFSYNKNINCAKQLDCWGLLPKISHIHLKKKNPKP